MRLFYSTDWHAQAKSPSARTDHFPDTIDQKIRHYFRTGHDLGADAFVCGGDLFESPYVAPSYARYLGELIQEESRGLPFFFVWGNHDEVGWNPKSVDRFSHSFFPRFIDNMILLDQEPYMFERNGETAALTGVSSYAQLDKHIKNDEGEIVHPRSRDYMVAPDHGYVHVHVVHGYLSPIDIFEDIPHTTLKEIQDTQADVIWTGHEHGGFPVQRLNDTWVHNPGSLARVSAARSEIGRTPNYSLATIENNEVQVENVVCDIARPGDEVLDRSIIEEKEEKEKLLAALSGNIESTLRTMDIQHLDIRKVLEGFKDTEDPEVYERAKSYLGL